MDKYFYTDLTKLILDYLELTINENKITEISEKYISNFIININEFNNSHNNRIRNASVKFNYIPLNLINLTCLDCNWTKVYVVPNTLVNLTYLNCSNTNISVIPLLVNLTHLNCFNTNISVIPSTSINLTHLDCGYTKVSVIPKELTKMTILFQ